jgi:hypothetical protein
MEERDLGMHGSHITMDLMEIVWQGVNSRYMYLMTGASIGLLSTQS